MGKSDDSEIYEAFVDTLKTKLIPVITIKDADQAWRIGQTLIDNGLPCAEITFRTTAAGDAIRNLSALDDILLGAGTVLTIDQAKKAQDSGASFIVTPGLNPVVVEHCLKADIPVIPGVCTPTEIETALGLGVSIMKFFPAQSFGGVKTLKALGGPYPMVKFIPTGGINTKNLQAYLDLSNVLACGGSWMVDKQLIAVERYDEIARLTKEAAILCKKG